jgi:hypothetical protein
MEPGVQDRNGMGLVSKRESRESRRRGEEEGEWEEKLTLFIELGSICGRACSADQWCISKV